MRSVKEIKKRLLQFQVYKSNAFHRDDDFNYKLYLKIENLLKWILDEDHHPKYRNKQTRKHRKIKTDEKNM